MPVIYCNINMFDYDQTVYIREDDGTLKIYAKIPYPELSKFLAKMAENENIKEIHLNGLTAFSLETKNKILKEYSAKFGNKEDLIIIIEGDNNE